LQLYLRRTVLMRLFGWAHLFVAHRQEAARVGRLNPRERLLAWCLQNVRQGDQSTFSAMNSFVEYLVLLGDEAPDQPTPHDSAQLAGALLDGGVPDIELGALVATLRLRANPEVVLDGLVTALRQRVNRWRCGSARHTPVAIGCYGGNWNVPNLALLSQIAACLYAAGYCDNLSQTKALAVVATANRQVG